VAIHAASLCRPFPVLGAALFSGFQLTNLSS
jgi:hypothetical protein